MIEYIERNIVSGKLKANEKIPSMRDLMHKFVLSKGTVSRGLDYLCKEGFLEKQIGSGTFVRKNKNLTENPQRNAVTVFCSQSLETLSSGRSMFSQILLGIQDVAKERNRSVSLIHTLGAKPYYIPPEQLEYANKNSYSIIFIGEYDSFYDDIDIKIPSVATSIQKNFKGKFSLVNLDAYDAALVACQYFKEHKKHHIEIITNTLPVFHHRAKLFEQQWNDTGGTCKIKYIDECFTLPECDAYFFVSDSIAQRYSLKVMEKTGKPLHQSACMFSIEGKRFLDHDFHKFPTYAVDWRYVGKLIFEEMIYRIENLGSPARSINVAGHLKY